MRIDSGEIFGESEVLFEDSRIVDVKVVDYSVVYRIKSDDFINVLKLYPDESRVIAFYAKEKLRNIKKFQEIIPYILLHFKNEKVNVLEEIYKQGLVDIFSKDS